MSEIFNHNNIILEIEDECERLNHLLIESNSNRLKLISICSCFDKIFSTKNKAIIDANIPQYILEFNRLIIDFDPICIPFEIINLVITVSKELDCLSNEYIDNVLIKREIIRIENATNALSLILNGDEPFKQIGLFFPVLEEVNSQTKDLFGLLESFSIQIRKSKNPTKFLVIPSELHLEQKIKKQIDDSWLNAINYVLKSGVRLSSNNYEVMIAFNLKEGVLVGNSLGVVLTVGFIEELLKFHNSRFVVNSGDNIAITGGLDENGKLVNTSKEIIRIKTEIVFYSSMKIFCVPKVNEFDAEERLSELRKLYPNRKLEIIGLTNLDDLLNRRNVVEIRKQKLIVRTNKFVKKNWISAVATLLLSMLFAYLFVMDFDDNPAMFEHKGRILFVKNQNGKVLWNVKMNYDPAIVKIDRTYYSRKLVDINTDGINEVIIAEEDILPSSREFGRVVCFDKDKNIIWKYVFNDTVSTFRKWTSTYQISIIDTVTINNSISLLLLARNIPNFPNAVFKLDLITGKRIKDSGTLWNAGAINSGIIGDFDKNNKTELIFAGSHNGFERAFISSIDISNLDGQTPAPPRYVFNNLPSPEINSFILLPHTDYSKLECRSNTVLPHHLNFNKHSEEIEVTTFEGYKQPVMMYYGFDNQLNYLWMDCGDSAQQLRDSLVAKSVLQKPYTNTNEYFEILRKQIEYWDGEKFVNIDERKK